MTPAPIQPQWHQTPQTSGTSGLVAKLTTYREEWAC